MIIAEKRDMTKGKRKFMKKRMKRTGGWGRTVILCEGIFILLLLTVVYFQGKTADTLRRGEEARSAAVLAAELRAMEETAGDEGLTDVEKKLILYHKAGSAREAVWGTAASEEVKRGLSLFLGDLSQHLLDSPLTEEAELLTSEERDTLRLLSAGSYEAVSEPMSAEGQGETGSKVVTEDVSAEEKAANRFLGVEDVLRREWRGICSCKTAYVRFDEKGIPCEVVRYCPPWCGEEVGEACLESVKEYVEKMFPEEKGREWRMAEGGGFVGFAMMYPLRGSDVCPLGK